MARPYVITIACEKGGVGKTTLATNLAIYLKGLAEDLPITLFSFDNHFTIDRMFQLNRTRSNADVSRLFDESPGSDLVEAGQYGVQIIPSSSILFDLQNRIQTLDRLAQNLSRSNLGGLLIIDTSPVLDIYTRSALFAADRVIVPIKDAPSLENCRNLSRFLADQGLSKTTLRLLPCLIDTRIHFEGPFKNSYQLLKAYAINRGYRCYEGFIAKSPKVESLGTNPDGKIYPILTHGRGTDVHLQFMHLARQIYLDYLENGPSRMTEVADRRYSLEARLAREYQERLSRVQGSCLGCGSAFPADGIREGSYYLESSDGSLAGFMEEDCFLEMILRDCYGGQGGGGLESSLRELFVESVERSYFLLQHTRVDNVQSQYDFYRLDQYGEKISGRSLRLKDQGRFGRPSGSKLMQLFSSITADTPAGIPSLFLAHRTGQTPAAILEHQAYLKWQTVFSRVRVDLAAETAAPENTLG